jgi:WD40 repeat protein
LSANGRRAAILDNRNLTIWNVDDAKPLIMLARQSGYVPTCSFDTDGRLIAVANARAITVWDVETTKVRCTISVNRMIRDILFTNDSRFLVVASTVYAGHSYRIGLWSIDENREVMSFPSQANDISALALSSDGRTLAAGGVERTIGLWDLPTVRPIGALRGHLDQVTGLAFSPDGSRLVSASTDGVVKVWDLTARPTPQSPRPTLPSPESLTHPQAHVKP